MESLRINELGQAIKTIGGIVLQKFVYKVMIPEGLVKIDIEQLNKCIAETALENEYFLDK